MQNTILEGRKGLASVGSDTFVTRIKFLHRVGTNLTNGQPTLGDPFQLLKPLKNDKFISLPCSSDTCFAPKIIHINGEHAMCCRSYCCKNCAAALASPSPRGLSGTSMAP